MTKLVDDMVEALERTRRFQLNVINPLLTRYYDLKQQEVEETKLTEEDLTDESEEVSGWDLPENFDEWGQGYGRCPICGTPWDIVRPGKGQPAYDCEDRVSDYTELEPEYEHTILQSPGGWSDLYHPLQSLPVEDKHG